MKLPARFCYFLIVSTFLVNISGLAKAQSGQNCFLLDANGNAINLEYLCGGSENNSLSRKRVKSVRNNFIVIPIKRRVGGTPVVEARFNGERSFEMLFDTGATMTVITESMARELDLEKTGSLPFQTASNNLIYFDTARVSSVQIENKETNNLNIAIAPTLNIGLLGQDFYGAYDITIRSNTIELTRR